MAYEYDIFVSYRRDAEALQWIRRFLRPLIEHRVGLEMNHAPTLFIHEAGNQIQAGTAWPVELGETIAKSRIMIALWTKNYLASDWSRQELSLMLERETTTKARTAANKYGLIVPIIAHDGETIPARLASAQQLKVKDWFNTRMPNDGPQAAALAEEIGLHAPGIAEAIGRAPAWQKGWPRKAGKKFLKLFETRTASQRKLPRFSRNR